MPRKRQLSSRQLVLIIGLTLAIYAGAIFLISRGLRANVRDQIISRDAEVLRAVAMMLQSELSEETPEKPADEAALFEVMLKTSRLKGVIGVRLFDTEGKFSVAFPNYIRDASLSESEVQALRQLKPIVYYYSQMGWEHLFWPETKPDKFAQEAQILTTTIPLHAAGRNRLQGIAQFIIDGGGVAEEFAALDRNLFRQSVSIFFAGGLLMAGGLGWAFYRLQRANRLLRERSESLLHANNELALVTRTSAVGFVSAHLLHEMKSQLFGLRSMLMAGGEGGIDWKVADAAAKRLQNLVNQMVDTIRNDEGSAVHYEVSLQELGETLLQRAGPLAETARVRFQVVNSSPGTVSNRTANLLIIILMSLVENAIQATAAGRHVRLILSFCDGRIECLVQDEGEGIPLEVQKSLFRPVVSRKEGSSGIGLALCKQLANHLNAELILETTGKGGTSFKLTMAEKNNEIES